MADPALPLFYARPRVLLPARHTPCSLAPATDYGFTSASNAVPLVAAEMATACRHYPVVFTDEAVPQPVAVLGLRAGENLFVDAQGRWQPGSYMPAYVRRYPFIFLEDEARAQFTLCIDEAAAGLTTGGENPLFDPAGRPTALTQAALAFCHDYQAQHAPTTDFTRALAASGLLADHRADITLNDGRRMSLSGFRVIDEARFNAMPDAQFRHWRAQGWLAPVYAHFVSMGAWSALVDRVAPLH